VNSGWSSTRSQLPSGWRLIEGGSAELAAGVRAGQIDLALIGTAGQPPAGVGSFTVVSERLVAMVPPGHPLLDHGPVGLRDVTACPLICMPPGTGLRGVLDQACAAAGLRPVIAVQASAGEAIIQLAQRGLGIGILSESMTGTGHDGLTAMVIEPGCARGDLEPGSVARTAGAHHPVPGCIRPAAGRASRASVIVPDLTA
jgi:DNA-binding transcriptional LysR family regulator